MSDLLADVSKLVNESHPGSFYIGVVKAKHRTARFGVVFEFRRH